MPPNPVPSIAEARDNFISIDQGVRRCARCSCKHCGKELVENITRMRSHLQQCIRYTATRAASANNEHVGDRRTKLDTYLATAVFTGGMKFDSFEEGRNPWLRKAICEGNPGYVPPTRHRLAGELLQDGYNRIRTKVLRALDHQPLLNFCTDESEDHAGHRLANLSAVIPGLGSFHLVSQDMKSLRFSAQKLSDWVLEQLRIWTGDDLSRVNSITTDTCNIMRSMHQYLERQMPHVFFLLCDSHGLQLLTKDVVSHPQLQR